MKGKGYNIFLFLGITGLFLIGSVHVQNSSELPKRNKIDILNKVSNHYYLQFKPMTAKIELPRIFYFNGGVYFFGSTTGAINSNLGFTDEYYLTNEKEYDKNGQLLAKTFHIVTLDGNSPGVDFSISSHLLFFWLAGGLLLWFSISVAQKYRRGIGVSTPPKGIGQNLFETLYIFVRDQIALDVIGTKKYRNFAPYLTFIFFFVMILNLLGLIPWSVSSTADFTITLSLAFFTFIITQYSGNKFYWRHMLWMPGIPIPIRILLGVIEFIGTITKPIILAIRLFANMLSGKILIYGLMGIIFVIADLLGPIAGYAGGVFVILISIGIIGLKIFVCLLQAYIFTFLSALYFSMAVEEDTH